MKKDSIIDYLGYFSIKITAPVIRVLPMALSLFLGRRIGSLLYYFDFKHKSLAYANIKTAFEGNLSPSQLSQITRRFFQGLVSNFIEALYIPKLNQQYVRRYIQIEGLEHIKEAFKKNKGVILVGVHEGSWELSNTICSILDFPFNLFVRQQRHSRLDDLLNSYRTAKGCKVITRASPTMRNVIRVLQNNEAVGMVSDQGGKRGLEVEFFNRPASMSTLPIRLSLKRDCQIIPCFYVRTKGPYVKVIVEPSFEVKKTGNLNKDLKDNLERLTHIFEKYILRYPWEYLWSYKIWKYSSQRRLVILNDGKTGHIRQTQALARIMDACLKERDVQLEIETVEVKFKSGFSRIALNLSATLAGRYHCQGCLWCLRTFLLPQTYTALLRLKPDYVLSCGASLAPINFVFSRENLARSIVIMQPGLLSTRRFDLVIMPAHDNPPKKKNIVVTEGALNLIDEEYLASCVLRFASCVKIEKDLVLGLLLGGDTKRFKLSLDLLKPIISQIKLFLEKYDGEILITTSRRTSPEVEELIKQEFSNYNRCKLLVIANKKNIPEAVGGILGLSKIVIVSPESISMISEAASCGRYVVVFNPQMNIGRRHNWFLQYLAKEKYIYLAKSSEIFNTLEEIITRKPTIVKLQDSLRVKEALGGLF